MGLPRADSCDPGAWLSVLVGTERPLSADLVAVRLDGGDVVAAPGSTARLPIGVHALLDPSGVIRAYLAIVPGRLLPPPRSWAFSALPRCLRSARSWGVGDFADLARLARWCAESEAVYLFLGPTAAGRVRPPVHSSPYSPSSRLFHDLLLIHPPAVPGWSEDRSDLRKLRDTAEGLRSAADVLDAALALKLRALRILFAHATGGNGIVDDAGFADFRRRRGATLAQFALHCAIEHRFGSDLSRWPTELSTPEAAEESAWAAEHHELRLFFEWCQWQLDEQLARVADRGVGLVRDLPVGTPAGSADGWMWRGCTVQGWELGAPGDYFNPDGHRWGLVPQEPSQLCRLGMQPFRAALRATLERAAGVRIDHALGLVRQFWIPAGGPVSAGSYVPQPLTAFADIIAIEAHQNAAFVATEELGTSAPGLPEALRERGFLDYAAVVSDDFPSRSPGGIVSATTHDLPTSTGCWTGADEDSLRRAGIDVDPAYARRARRRLAQVAQVADTAPAGELVEQLYRRLGESASAVVVVPLEDLLGIERRPNAPGSGDRWPSFRQPVALPPDVEASALHRGLLRLIGAGRA